MNQKINNLKSDFLFFTTKFSLEIKHHKKLDEYMTENICTKSHNFNSHKILDMPS